MTASGGLPDYSAWGQLELWLMAILGDDFPDRHPTRILIEQRCFPISGGYGYT
jgi:hypothetical protein